MENQIQPTHEPNTPPGGGQEPSVQATAPAVPENPYAQIAQITSGLIKSEEDVKALAAMREQYSTVSAKLAQIEAEKEQISPLAAAINKMTAEGATSAEIERFVRFQAVDVDAMEPVTAYKTLLQFKHPELSPADIEEYLTEKFNLTEEKSVTGSLRVAGVEAKQELARMKVAASNTEASTRRQQMEQQQAALRNQWQQLIDATLGNYSEQVVVKEGDVDYSHTYVPTAEAMEFAKSVVHNDALVNKRTPDVQSQAHAKDLARRMAIAYDLENYTKTIIADAYAKGKLAAVTATAGPNPAAPSPTPGNPTPPVERKRISGLG